MCQARAPPRTSTARRPVAHRGLPGRLAGDDDRARQGGGGNDARQLRVDAAADGESGRRDQYEHAEHQGARASALRVPLAHSSPAPPRSISAPPLVRMAGTRLKRHAIEHSSRTRRRIRSELTWAGRARAGLAMSLCTRTLNVSARGEICAFVCHVTSHVPPCKYERTTVNTVGTHAVLPRCGLCES